MALPTIPHPNVHNAVVKAQQLAAKGKQTVDQLAAKTKQDEQQLVARIKQAVDQLAAKAKQDERQLVAGIKQAVDQLAAKAKQDERQLVAVIRQAVDQLAAKTKQDERQSVSGIKQAVDQLAAKIKQDDRQLVAGTEIVLSAVRNPVVYGTRVQDGCRYQYDETSEEWKTACLPLPCSTAVQFPGYATAVIPGTINGVAVIVQLWKGRCERLCGTRLNFPGGVGAEVGIYIKGQPGDKMWWPAPYVIPGFTTSISWHLVNPSTRKVFLDAPTQTTYWRNRWMTIQSYNLYQQNCNGLVPNYTGYTLNYTINGAQQTAW